MSEEWKKFVDDPRTVCKYGTKCYQKNPQHQDKFKHPPHKRKQDSNHDDVRKKAKICIETNAENQIDSSVSVTDIDDSEERNDPWTSFLKTPSPAKPPKSADSEKCKITNYACIDPGADPKIIIKDLFLVDMPEDFYSFWDFFEKERNNGTDILKSVNLDFVGPFEVLAGTLPKIEDKDKYLVHFRYFYDPPEFQTVFKTKGKGEFHIGYFRDSPDENPAFVGSNDSSKNCTISPIASNIFGALYLHLESEKKKSPFAAISYQKLRNKIKVWADEHKFSLEKFDTRKRVASLAVTKCFHGAGIVVPYNKSTQLGYRPLVETDANLKNMLLNLASTKSDAKKNEILSELQPVITYANIAMDECDFGTGLELGIDLFSSGLREIDDTIMSTLSTAYNLLKREAFIKILKMHLKYRRKDTSDLSALSI